MIYNIHVFCSFKQLQIPDYFTVHVAHVETPHQDFHHSWQGVNFEKLAQAKKSSSGAQPKN